MSIFKKIAAVPGMQPLKPAAAPTTPNASGVSSKRSVDTEEQGRVMRMQQIMSELAKAIDQNPGAYTSKTNSKSETALSAAIRNTGKNTATPFDGVWGDKTINALTQISQNATNKEGKLIATITPGQHYGKVTKDQVIKAADDNVKAIISLMKAVGFGGMVPAGLASGSGKVYDMVPGGLKQEDKDPRVNGNNPVTPEDLDNLWTFYDFTEKLLKKNKIAGNDPVGMKRIADFINNSNIVRLAQSSMEKTISETPGTPDANDPNYKTPAPAPEYKAPVETAAQNSKYNNLTDAISETEKSLEAVEPGLAREDKKEIAPAEVKLEESGAGNFGTLTVADFTGAINWFEGRAKLVNKWAYGNLKRRAKKDDGTDWTQDDLLLSREYVRAMNALAAAWRAQAKDHIKGRRPGHAKDKDGNELEGPVAYVDQLLLDGSGGGSNDYGSGGDSNSRVVLNEDGSGEGRNGRNGRHEGLGRRKGDDDLEGGMLQLVSSFPKGPLNGREDFDKLVKFIDIREDAHKNIIRNMNSRVIDRSVLRNASPGLVASMYNKPGSDMNAKSFTQDFPGTLKAVLKSIVDRWGSYARSAGIPNVEEVMDQQRSELTDWGYVIYDLQRDANSPDWQGTDMVAKPSGK